MALSGVETDSELWIVADVQDRADDVFGWNEYVKVADIVRGQTEATVSLPEAWREQALKLRGILYSKEASPGGELYLLSMHAGGGSVGSYMTGMFCGSRAWSDYQNRTAETLLFDIVPCRRNGVVALVDLKTHEVVPHAGTLAAGEMEFMGTGVIAQSATVSSVSGFMIIVR